MSEDMYQKFAPFYRALVRPRKHFESQVTLLNDLFSRQSIKESNRILDAACGTGDVLAALHQLGFENLSGIDASKAMLAEAAALGIPPEVSLEVCSWQELNQHFKDMGLYDFIFILGNALAHAHVKEIPDILKSVYLGLTPRGCFAIDIRNWGRDQDGNLFEPNRPIGVYKSLGKFEASDHYYLIDNSCFYKDNRQFKTYRLQELGEDQVQVISEDEYEFSFALFDLDEVRCWLQYAGFQSVEVQERPDWPYTVLISKKQ